MSRAGNSSLGKAFVVADLGFGDSGKGMLLDEWHGMHPHTTWSDCRMGAAVAERQRLGYPGAITGIGVVRNFALTRSASAVARRGTEARIASCSRPSRSTLL